MSFAFSKKVQTCTTSLIPFFFWQLGHRENDALRVGITAQIPIRLLADCCFHEKAARCPSSYPKAFRLLPKSGSSKVCFELLKTFRVTPKTLPPGCLSEVGQPVLTYGVLVLFLVLYTVHSYLVVQRGTPDAEQCRSQFAVAFRLFQRTDNLFLFHVVHFQ